MDAFPEASASCIEHEFIKKQIFFIKICNVVFSQHYTWSCNIMHHVIYMLILYIIYIHMYLYTLFITNSIFSTNFVVNNILAITNFETNH